MTSDNTRTSRISIDGATASGKTYLGHRLAERYAGTFLDTGLTFRGIAYLSLLKSTVRPSDDWRLRLTHQPAIYVWVGENKPATLEQPESMTLDGSDITDKLWGFEVDNRLDKIANDIEWRIEILRYHRYIVEQHSTVIAAGRDVATTLLTDATLHVYLSASFAVRRERRRAQHRTMPNRSVVVGSVTKRDLATLGYIRALPNSIEVDTTHLTRDAVFASIVRKLKDTTNE